MVKCRKGDNNVSSIYSKRQIRIIKNLIGEFKEWDDAMDCAEKAVEGHKGLRYIVEETNGCVNSYGELIAEVVAEGVGE